MGLSASQGRMLLLTARKSDLEYRAQQISQKRLILSQQLESISTAYEDATSNRQMKITTWLDGVTDKTASNSSKTTNLTYAALISGTLKEGSGRTGIQAYERTEDQEYISTTAYRLVDADGAIVVSDVAEIPTNARTTTKQIATTDSLGGSAKDGIYEVGTVNSDGKFQADEDAAKYIVVDNADSALYKQIFSTTDASGVGSIEVDTTQKNNSLIRVKSKNSEGKEIYTYYNMKGVKQSAPEEFNGTAVTAVKSADKIAKSNKTTVSSGDYLKEGSDGKYTLYDSSNTIVARYVVDPSLKYGSTDTNGTTAGPNYLQDCLRNGKYLIQKGGVDTEDENKYKWKNVSWDCVATIQDGYYQDDDDTAKAKYDRLQNEIQAQDKKLELELDNIETQRSAVTTEEESVKKVIDENIEGSFNAFG